jgi:protein-disulfide isomerase/uncharacterized membrane protein/peroxiredoxin
MKRSVLVAFTLVALFAAFWAFHLVGKHYAAEAQLLVPGALCGPDGGCAQVLSSKWSTIGGVPVTVPAIALFGWLAALSLLSLRGKFEADRLAAYAVSGALAGVGLGGFLLYEMLVSVGEICPYCLIMDGSNLAVLLLGAACHRGGMRGGFRAAMALLKKPTLSAPAPLVLAIAVVAAFGLDSASRNHWKNQPAPVVEATPTPSTAPPAASAVAQPTAPAASGTIRVVLTEDVHDIPLDASIPQKGPKDAPVTIVLFEDFQCPFCKKLSGNVELLLEEVKDVRVAFMHFPMHQQCNATTLQKNMHKFACVAASAGVCAHEQGKFWPMHDLMFRNNQDLAVRDLQGYAAEAGLDVAKWQTCMRDPATTEKVKADSKIGGDAGVSGTPALFVNGHRLVGAQPVESLKATIEAVRSNPTGRVLLDVARAGEITGPVDGPADVAIAAFRIDAFEASVVDGRARSVAGVEPTRGLTWYEADAACKVAGKRLCTEAEWLTACTGAEPIDANGDGVYSNDPVRGRQRSYGEHYREGVCADARKKGETVGLLTGNHPQCRTPEGVYDLEGVGKEWVNNTPDKAALKGGSYFSGDSARCAYHKDGESPDTKDESISFRCCAGGGDAVASAAGERFPGGKVGDAIQTFDLPALDGPPWSSASLRGKAFVMTFWASWCGPCKKELPALASMYEQLRAEGIEVLGVNVDENEAAARAYLKANPLPFKVVLDTKAAVMDRFDTRGVPTTFWVTSSGKIRQRSVGFDEQGGVEKLVRDARALIGG